MKIIKHTNEKIVIDSKDKQKSGFKYIMNIYNNNALINRVTIYPHPNKGYGVFETKFILSMIINDHENISRKDLSFDFTNTLAINNQ